MAPAATLARLVGLLAALHAAAQGAPDDCSRYLEAPAAGVHPAPGGGWVAFQRSTEPEAPEAMSLRLKSLLAQQLAGSLADARVTLRGARPLPPLDCDRQRVHRLLVQHAEVSTEPASEPGPASVDPQRAIVALESARSQRTLSRGELERLRQLYWSVGDLQKAQALASELFGAR